MYPLEMTTRKTSSKGKTGKIDSTNEIFYQASTELKKDTNGNFYVTTTTVFRVLHTVMSSLTSDAKTNILRKHEQKRKENLSKVTIVCPNPDILIPGNVKRLIRQFETTIPTTSYNQKR